MQWHLYQDIFKRITFNPHTGHKYAWKCQILIFIGVPLICHTLGHFPSLLELLYQKS